MGKPVSSPSTAVGSSVRITTTPTIKNAPAVGLIDGNGDFSNYHLAVLILSVPLAIQESVALVVGLPWLLSGVSGYAILLALLGVPVTTSYWTYQSRYGKRQNDKIPIPEGNVERFVEIKDEWLRKKYHGKNKIPMVVFHDAYIAGGADFKGQSSSSLPSNATRGIFSIYETRRGSLIISFSLIGRAHSHLLSMPYAKPY